MGPTGENVLGSMDEKCWTPSFRGNYFRILNFNIYVTKVRVMWFAGFLNCPSTHFLIGTLHLEFSPNYFQLAEIAFRVHTHNYS
jgi:hypothetical protein